MSRSVGPFHRFLTLAVLVFAASPAHARKFDFKNESLATYLRGTYGPSQVLGTPFANSSGAETTSFDQKVVTNYSGEFGLVFSTTHFNLRVGAELILPKHISDVKGLDAGGSELFNLDTKTSALVPTLYLDFIGFRTATSKGYFGVGLGYAYVKTENIYTLTTAGQTTYTGQSDFSEKAEGEAIASHVYLGYEMLFADNATVVFDLGYRYLTINDLNHLKSADTFLGSVERGAKLRKADGNAREIDLGGGYIGLAFRFYIGL